MNFGILRWRNWILPALLLAVFSPNIHWANAACDPIPPGLVGWWPGEGNANDIAGTNNGVLQGGATATAAGYVGTCFAFDGTNGFVQVPDSPTQEPTNLTVEAWVRFDGLDSAGLGGSPAGEQYIVFKQNSRTNFFEGYFLGKIRLAGRDTFTFGVSSATGQAPEADSSITVTTNQWYHVAGVRGSNFLQIYVNGVLTGQTNVTFAQNYSTNDLFFGSSGQPYWDRKLKGQLDEVSLYNRALGANEIAAIYAAGHAGKCKVPTIVAIELAPGVQQSSDLYPVLTIGGMPGQTYGIQTTTPLNPTNAWVGMTNLTLSGSIGLWQCPIPALTTRAFFRAVPGTISIP